MKITGKTLHVIFEHNVSVGNGAVEATIQHSAWISENKDGEICIDLDSTDIENIKFMGLPIESGYEGYKKFKKTMSELGIDVVKMFDTKAAELITDEDMDLLKSMYKR
jgi:hypothetical protein